MKEKKKRTPKPATGHLTLKSRVALARMNTPVPQYTQWLWMYTEACYRITEDGKNWK